MIRLRHGLPTLLSFGIGLLMTQPSLAAQWRTSVNYGGSVAMDLYVPDTPDPSPGVVVALHYCTGSAAGAHSWFQTLADQYGFLIITPDAPGECFDAAVGRSGERAAVVQMVEYVIEQEGADPARVFSAGASSGACMTNSLLASYPEVFAAGSVLAGVPAGMWTGGSSCNGSCNTNPPSNTPQQWGDIARNASGNYDGEWPRVQLWHSDPDPTLFYPNLAAEVAQWTNLHGLSDSDATTGGGPNGWTRVSYTNSTGVVVVEANTGTQQQGHDLTGKGLWPDVVRFFGLDQDAPVNPGTGGAGGETGTAGDGNSGGDANTGGIANTGGGSNTGGVANTGGANGDGTCVSGVQTGSVCDPAQDTDVCVRSNRECVCGADSLWACTQTGDGSGGADTGAGGSQASTGGSQTSTGGVPASGGASVALTGGVTSISTGGRTGTPGTGGIGAIVPATGGTSATTPSTGGTSTGTPAAGGTSATTPSTGGTSATSSGTGGTSAASPATGGASSGVSTGGSTASAAGGSVPTDTDTSSGSDDGGCSCRLGGGTDRQSRGALVALVLIGLAILRRERRAGR